MAKTRSMSRNLNHNDVASSSLSTRKRSMALDNNGFLASWSDLTHDVLILVMMQLGVVDFIAFSCVCKSWKSLALSNKKTFMLFKPPMSISIEPRDKNQDSYCYLEDFEGRRFKTILPHSGGTTCFGVTCGYVVLFGRETRDFWLVNPITRHELHFPNYPIYVGPNKEKVKAILVFSPSISAWVFLFFMMFKKISFCVAGKPRWSHVPSTVPIFDLHYFKGKIYTLYTDRSLRELRLNPNQNPRWTLLETKVLPNQNLILLRLVSSSEKLYGMTLIQSPPINVLELDFGEMKWVSPEKSVGEYAFFISYVNYSAAYKLQSWANPQRQHSSHYYFLDDDKSLKCTFYSQWMWYFPHDCLNVNLLD